jgi:hypothetical protein
MATLFSLAERGLLVIREQPRGRFGQRHFVLERAARTAHLTPHEEAALAVAFGATEAASVPLSKARSHFTRPSRWREFKSAVMRELAEADLLDPRRQASRRRFTKVGVAFLILAVLAIAPSLFLVREHGGWPFLVPAALGLVSLVSFIIMGAQTPLSNNGVRRAEQWRAFKKHIAQPQDIEPRWGAAGSAEARILPVAIALGLAAAWSKYLKKRNAHTPAWFHAASGLDSGQAFATFVAYGGAGAHGGSGAGAGAGGAAGGGASGAS